jgi:hypothetical protein
MKNREAYLLYTTLYSLCSKKEHCVGQQQAKGVSRAQGRAGCPAAARANLPACLS